MTTVKLLLNEEQLSDLLFSKSLDLGIKDRDISVKVGILKRIGVEEILNMLLKRYPEHRKEYMNKLKELK